MVYCCPMPFKLLDCFVIYTNVTCNSIYKDPVLCSFILNYFRILNICDIACKTTHLFYTMNSCKLKEFNHGQILIHREFIIYFIVQCM